jgi:hypothetical protein
MKAVVSLATAALVACGVSATRADEAELAKKRANPLADLTTVPLQFNDDCCFGPRKAGRFLLSLQPVVPIKLGDEWNLITRTVMPIIAGGETNAGLGGHAGLGDTIQNFFLTPRHTVNGVSVGLGPTFLWPSATDRLLGTEKWGAGPSINIVKQERGWTYGILAYHVWSYAGVASRSEVSLTYAQPFISYTFPDTTAIGLTTESAYDYVARQWTVPLVVGASRIVRFGTQPVSLGLSGKFYPVKPIDGPTWGARLTVTFLFPKI